MLISPFKAKRNWILLGILAAIFIGLFAVFGVVEANDTHTYLTGSVRVSPLYPSLIALFRALFSESLYLPALVLVQELLCAYAIFSLMAFVRARFSLSFPFSLLLALGFVGAYILRLLLVGREALYCNAIMTEAICYPLYFLFVKYAFAAWDGRDFRPLLSALILAFLLACTRGQLIWLILPLGILFLLILRGRGDAKTARRRLLGRALLAGACYGVGILLCSFLYHYLITGVASETTMAKETVLGALLYNSGAEDAALFPPGSDERLLLEETLRVGEAEGLTYKSAPKGFIGHFKHYESSHDELRDRLYERMLARYESESLSDDAMRLVQSGYANDWIPGLLSKNFGRYLVNCAINGLGGLVRTNSIMRGPGLVWSAIVYALCAVCLWLSKKRPALGGERRFLSLILLCTLINAVFCSFGVFELSRYVYYNFSCMYLALALYLHALLNAFTGRRRARRAP